MSKIRPSTQLALDGATSGQAPVSDGTKWVPTSIETTAHASATYLSVVNVKGFGAAGDGSTDDTSAVASAIAALPAAGGTLFFPAGSYKLSALDIHGKTSVSLVGSGNGFVEASTSPNPASRLVFSTTGSGVALDAHACQAVRFADLDITYSSTSFTGTLIDVHGAADPNGVFMPLFERCRIGGDYPLARRTAAALVNVGDTIEATFRDVMFHDAVRAVLGPDGTTYTFATVTVFDNCKFEGFSSAPILNPGQSWKFLPGTVFEPLSSGACGAIECVQPADSLYFAADCWDNTGAGQWITFTGSGLWIGGGARLEVNTSGTLLRLTGTCGGVTLGDCFVFGVSGATLITKAGGSNVSNVTIEKSCYIEAGIAVPAPTIAAGVGAGTGATHTMTGTDKAQQINLSSGTGPSNGTVATVTFAMPKGDASYVVNISGRNSAGAGNGNTYAFYATNQTIAGYDIAWFAPGGWAGLGGLSGAWQIACSVNDS